MFTSAEMSRSGGGRGGRAFTMIEIMFAVLILGVLLALLIGGVKMVTRMSKSTVDRQAVNSIRAGVTQFKQLFGIPMPMVRERTVDQNPGPHVFIAVPATGPSRRNRVCVYKPTDHDYLDELQGEELDRKGGPFSTVNNPFADYRFSERSIPIYLLGQLEIELFPGQPIGPNNPVIDGVSGAGFYKPLPDGTYALPADVLHAGPATAQATNRKAGRYDPLISVNSSAPKLLINPDNSAPSGTRPEELVVVTDRNNVPIRYYHWAPDSSIVTPSGIDLHKLNVPWMVGRLGPGASSQGDVPGYTPPPDRDLEKNPSIKGATFAIVAAGPDGLFGDEDQFAAPGSAARAAFERMMIAAGFPASDTDAGDIVKARVKAEEDNIVEVGQ